MIRFFMLLAAVSYLLLATGCNETPVNSSDDFTLTGQVIDDVTGNPIIGAFISLNPTLNSTISDTAGRFSFVKLTTEVESYTLNIEQAGYRRFVRSIATETIDGDVSLIATLERPTVSTNPPTRPSNPSPAVGSIDQARTLNLMWTASAPIIDELRFDVYLGDRDGVTRIATAIDEMSYQVAGLNFGENYTWQVAAYTAESDTLFGPTWFFRTEVDPSYSLGFALNRDGQSVVYGADAGVDESDYFEISSGRFGAFRPKFSPDGNNIAYLQIDGTDFFLTVANADGSNRRRVFRSLLNIYPEIYDFSWSPDGTQLVFGYLNNIVSVEVSTLRPAFIRTFDTGVRVMEVDVHPDGSQYLFNSVSGNGLVTNILRYSTRNAALDTILRDTTGLITGPEYDPSGTKFIVSIDVSGTENVGRRQLNANLFEIDLATRTRRDLSEDRPSGTNDLSPTYSPDGGFVYFTRGLNTPGSQPAIWRVRPVTTTNLDAEEVLPRGNAPTLR